MDLSWITLRRLAQSLPFVFALHVFEESLGFVQWFNARVEPDLSWQMFMAITGTAFVVTTLVGAQLAVSRGRAIAFVATAWVGLLMFANGLVHVAASIVDGGYVPGLGTAVLLYLPLSLLLFAAITVECGLSRIAVAAVALLAGIPMFVQGWLVIAEGSRLF
jgi:Protein of unknown function with HXXEE motif